jgi:hypothetical protein
MSEYPRATQNGNGMRANISILIVWFGAADEVIGFQLCYDRNNKERALTWKDEHIYTHDSIDDGEHGDGVYKGSPILKADGVFDKDEIARRIKLESGRLNKEIADFVYWKILAY